jgi:hypothetical protein
MGLNWSSFSSSAPPPVLNTQQSEDEPIILSKRKQKRLEKLKKYEEGKPARRAMLKEKKKEGKLKRKAEIAEAVLNSLPIPPGKKHKAQKPPNDQTESGVRVVIDLDFTDLMTYTVITRFLIARKYYPLPVN